MRRELPSANGAADVKDNGTQGTHDQPAADQRQYHGRIRAQKGLSLKQVYHVVT
jgi:hypothetical protein